MKFLWGVLCGSAIVSQDDKLTLVDIIDHLNFNQLPKIATNVTVAIVWVREAQDGDESISTKARISHASTVPLQPGFVPNIEFDLNLTAGSKTLRSLIYIQGISIDEAGENILTIEVKTDNTWNSVGKIAFEVTQNTEPENTIELAQP